MATFVILRRYNDPNSGQPQHKPLFVFTGSDASEANGIAGRLNRAARQVWQFKQMPQSQQLPDNSTWLTAAKATLGALDPEAVADVDNVLFDAYYTVSEVPAFVEPTEAPPANDQERITRDERDLSSS